MAKGISISIGSDAKAFLAGIKSGVIAPLEDAADTLDALGKSGDKAGSKIENSVDGAEASLKDLGRAGDKAGDEISRSLDKTEDSLRKSQKETDDFKKKFRDMADTVKQESRDAGRDIGTNFKRGTDGAGEGLKDFKQESASTAKESAASFDGSADSIVDAFQEVAANAFIGFGPAGLVAGLAAAAGIGLISAAIVQGGEDAERLKERVSDLTGELIAVGREGGPGVEYLVSKIEELATSTEDGVTNLKDLKKAADGSGSSFKDLAQAYAGNAEGIAKMLAKGKERIKQLEDESTAIDTTTNAGIKNFSANEKKAKAQEQYNSYLTEAKKVADAAAEADRNYALAGGPEMERKAALIATVDGAYDEAAGAASDYVNAESGLLDTGAYIAAMLAKEEALRNYQQTLAESPLDASAKAFLDAQGVEAAATFLQGYKTATPAQQAELNRIWSEAGRTSSGTYAATLQAGMPKTINGPAVSLDTTAAERSLALLSRPRTIELKVNGNVTRIGNQVW